MTDYLLAEQQPLRPSDAAAAVIVVSNDRYLLQLRDQKAGIFYPGHWGLFGGAIDENEAPVAALCRELYEEIGLETGDARLLTEFSFTFGRHGRIRRYFYEVRLDAKVLPDLRLREGREMRAFSAADILTRPRVVPYDSFAVWLHASGQLR